MAKSCKEIFAIVARTLIVLVTPSAAILVFTCNDKSNTNSSCLANYKIWTGFMYFAVIHISACVYNVLALCLPKGSGLWRLVVFLDMIFLVLLSTSWTATLVSYLYLRNGNPYVGWPRVCNLVPEFCRKILGALICGGIGCALSFVFFCFPLQHAVDYLLIERRPT